MALNSTANKSGLKPSALRPGKRTASLRRHPAAVGDSGLSASSLDGVPPAVAPGSGPVEGDVALTSHLCSAFGVDFELPPGANQVIVESSGQVVEGHLQVFAAGGREVPTTSLTYDDETMHEAAVREFRQSQAVGFQSPKLLGHCARLGIEAGKSKAAIARATGMSRSLIARAAPVRALMDKHPDLALSRSHFETVLPLDEPEQERLLQEAADKKLPVHALEQLIATAHPERQRGGNKTLTDLVELAGLAERFGAEWQQNQQGCVDAVRRLLRLTGARAPHLLGVPHGTDETA